MEGELGAVRGHGGAASMLGVIGALLLPKTARHRLTREFEAAGVR